MRIRVNFFALLREEIGRDEVALDVSEGSSCGEVVSYLQKEFPNLLSIFQSSLVAVNGDYATGETPLSIDDELAILPPVSGG